MHSFSEALRTFALASAECLGFCSHFDKPLSGVLRVVMLMLYRSLDQYEEDQIQLYTIEIVQYTKKASVTACRSA
ncbi:hypothetical protein CH363_09610 [Leptospira haakeii]|uniref:Uncharacterized protein n=1 Tax=Leptospira haakeii TaxID=2023198 RepID=A0ABX4PKQ9_9LEPT|nr:hypothetical protein CH363_09610 [Leptospira haakeii]PKA19751.1 hypothetical protein CH377_10235 [Leptospira haakeii]